MRRESFEALRVAATLVHALPGLRARVHVGDLTLLEVARLPLRPAGPMIGPCMFRVAIARAHEQTKAGVQLTFMGLPEGVEPAVDVRVRTGDAVLPGGIYRVTVDDQYVYAFATTLPVRACRDVFTHLAGEGEARLHRDVATEISLVQVVSPREPLSNEREEQLEDVLAAFAAAEVLHDVASTPR